MKFFIYLIALLLVLSSIPMFYLGITQHVASKDVSVFMVIIGSVVGVIAAACTKNITIFFLTGLVIIVASTAMLILTSLLPSYAAGLLVTQSLGCCFTGIGLAIYLKLR